MGWTRAFFVTTTPAQSADTIKIDSSAEVAHIEHVLLKEPAQTKRRAVPRVANPETLWLASGGRDPLDEEDLPWITPEEVAHHNNPSDGIWIIVEDLVYDCTHFTEIHPGGPEVFAQESNVPGNFGSGITKSISPVGALPFSSVASPQFHRTHTRNRVDGSRQCSREWPCSSCVRRGCPSICPDGVLPHKDNLQQAKTIKSLLAQNETLSAALSMQHLRQPASTANDESAAATSSSASMPLPQVPRSVASSVPPASSSSQVPSPDNEAPTHYDSAAGRGPGVLEVAGAATFHGRGAGALFLMDGESRASSLHPHRLALLLSVFAIAVVFQQPISCEQANETLVNHKFFNAASSLLAAAPHNFMSRPTLASVQALHVMVSFLFCSGDREGAKSAWTLLGATMRAAQSLGLHLNCESWNLPREETVERARTWWELFTYDLLQSLNFGRPYCIPTHFVQCPTPAALDHNLAADRSSEFHCIKYDLALLFGRVADVLASAELPKYSEVLSLDKALRSHEARAPGWMRITDFSRASQADDPPSSIAQRHMLCLLLHKALLALHRPWFAKAVMQDSGAEPMTSPWAASFNACCISARRHVQLMKSILVSSPKVGYRYAILQKLRSSICPNVKDGAVEHLNLNHFGHSADATTSSLSILDNGVLQAPNLGYGSNSSALFSDTSFSSHDPTAQSFSVSAPLPSWDLTQDPAGVLLSDSGDPLAWDPLSWANGDSIEQTLMFWNLASAGGTFDFTAGGGNETGGAESASLF
ncbi:hypothetical protein OIO90_004076 [Microbotryomycetes sp. JL221]|nr:hypothetical protein OIO90_004076 [Microbotryomycetes sp. JL221]